MSPNKRSLLCCIYLDENHSIVFVGYLSIIIQASWKRKAFAFAFAFDAAQC